MKHLGPAPGWGLGEEAEPVARSRARRGRVGRASAGPVPGASPRERCAVAPRSGEVLVVGEGEHEPALRAVRALPGALEDPPAEGAFDRPRRVPAVGALHGGALLLEVERRLATSPERGPVAAHLEPVLRD